MKITIGDDKKHQYSFKVKKQRFFNIEDYLPEGPIKTWHWKIFLFVTRRNVGKNYSTLQWLMKNNLTFAILRRRDSELQELKADIDKSWIKLYGIIRKGNNLYRAIKTQNKEGEEYYTTGEFVGQLVALSTVANMAGGTSQGLDVIWFDEFISHGNYLSNEQRKLISIISTMTRINPKTIFIGTSNPLAKSAPLFNAFDFWDDELFQWDDKRRVIKFMFPKDTFKPLENEEEGLAYLFAATSEEEINVNIYGSFGRENERDKQMTSRRFYRDKSKLMPMFHFYVDSPIKDEEPMKGTMFQSLSDGRFLAMDYASDITREMLTYAMTMSESIKTGTVAIGSTERADWIKAMLYQRKLFFTNYDMRQAIVDFVKRWTTKED